MSKNADGSCSRMSACFVTDCTCYPRRAFTSAVDLAPTVPVTDTPTPERGASMEIEPQPSFLRPQDFSEDFSHENGNYKCRCYRCGHYFVGHKRRVTCKLCVTIDALTHERDALRAECARKDAEIAALRDALTHEDIKLVWVTQGHEEFGIECTICIGDEYETLTNQADPITAIIETSKAVRAKLNPGAPRDGD